MIGFSSWYQPKTLRLPRAGSIEDGRHDCRGRAPRTRYGMQGISAIRHDTTTQQSQRDHSTGTELGWMDEPGDRNDPPPPRARPRSSLPSSHPSSSHHCMPAAHRSSLLTWQRACPPLARSISIRTRTQYLIPWSYSQRFIRVACKILLLLDHRQFHQSALFVCYSSHPI